MYRLFIRRPISRLTIQIRRAGPPGQEMAKRATRRRLDLMVELNAHTQAVPRSGLRLALDLLEDGQYLLPESERSQDDAPPFLGLENPIVCGIVVGLHDMRHPSVDQDRIYQPGLNLIVQNTDPL